MKFLHTADWHLGKILRGTSMIDDQSYILDEILRIAIDEKVDAIVIAGDIYDRAVPPIEAVNLFNEILTKILLEKNLPILCISGNHDSSARLNFGTKILERSNLFLRANLTEDLSPIEFEDSHGKIYFSLFPYMDSAIIRNVFDFQESNFTEEFRFVVQQARKNIPSNARSIAVAHEFVAGNTDEVTRSESERTFVGGVANIPPQVFTGFNYVALGHLHAPQKIGLDSIRYSGSPLKYSVDESKQRKGVEIVEIDGEGKIDLKFIDLKPIRDVRIIMGSFREILEDREKFPKSEDYIQVQLTELSPILNARDQLQAIYPNLLGIERVHSDLKLERQHRKQEEIAKMSVTDLFGEFYKWSTGENLNPAQIKILETCIENPVEGDELQ